MSDPAYPIMTALLIGVVAGLDRAACHAMTKYADKMLAVSFLFAALMLVGAGFVVRAYAL